MRITILCVGSRGDVQPFIALGAGLKKSGHDITIATHENFQNLLIGTGLKFSQVEGDIQEILQSEQGQQWLESNKNPIKFFTGIVRLCEGFFEKLLRDSARACEGAEAIIFSPLALCAYSIAEQKKISACMAALQPVSPTGEFASPMFPQYRLGKIYNLLTHYAARQFVWQPFRKQFNRWRREDLKLPPYGFWGPLVKMQRENFPLLYAFSPAVINRPASWRSACHMTGYWFLDHPDWNPPEDLLKFLNAGPPPVYIGFGSMSERDPHGLSQNLIRALQMAGQRGLILSGWADLPDENLPDNIFVIDSIPHDWLFPKMAAVVHHGGAGTTAAALRAGIPNIVIPFFADQHFWGAHVSRLGTGPNPIPRKNLTAENLAETIKEAVSNAQIRKRAESFGERIRKEDGVARAVEILETQIL
jgi:sterol 3beta-glucosyltransferase